MANQRNLNPGNVNRVNLIQNVDRITDIVSCDSDAGIDESLNGFSKLQSIHCKLVHCVFGYLLVLLVYILPASRASSAGKIRLNQQPVTLSQTDRVFVLSNGTTSATVDRRSGDLTSLKYDGRELLGSGSGRPFAYWSHVPQHGMATSDVTISPTANGGTRCEVAVKGAYHDAGAAVSHPGAMNIEIRYSLGKEDNGIYTYSILSHNSSDAAISIGEARFAAKLNNSLFDYMTIDAERSREMITADDWRRGTQLNMKEARRMTTGKYVGQVEHKYDYSAIQFDTPAYGWSSTAQHVGIWIINPSTEYLSGGPTKVELTAHRDVTDEAAPTLLNYWRGSHYGSTYCEIAAGEPWTRVVGPFLLYCNDGLNPKAMWQNALSQAADERSKWPYAWVSGCDYPLSRARCTITGHIKLKDSYTPSLAPHNMLVGLTSSDYVVRSDRGKAEARTIDWQLDARNYQFWTRADSQGRYKISNIRPGIYVLRAISDGVLGEFVRTDIKVETGQPSDLGVLNWVPLHFGKPLWQIGNADRTAREYLHGDHYYEWGLYDRYDSDFPNDVHFVIGTSDPAKDWNYCQPPHLNGTPTTWSIEFHLTNGIKGTATLRLAFAGTSSRRISIEVNDHAAGDTGNLVDTAVVRRDGIRGYWYERDISFDAAFLQAGKNEIRLTVPGGDPTRAVEYDSIILELK